MHEGLQPIPCEIIFSCISVYRASQGEDTILMRPKTTTLTIFAILYMALNDVTSHVIGISWNIYISFSILKLGTVWLV